MSGRRRGGADYDCDCVCKFKRGRVYTPVDERDELCASLCYCVIAINGFIFSFSFLLVCEYREYLSCDFLSRFITCGCSVFFFLFFRAA